MTEPNSNLLYVWTANGSMTSLSFPADLAPVNPADKQATQATQATQAPQAKPIAMQTKPPVVPDYAIEPFIDNLRRTVSSRSQYSEVPYNNEVSTRNQREPLPLFKFFLEPNKQYKLNALIRAKVSYKYTVPVLAKYTIETNSPGSFMNYRATYVSSHEINTGIEQNSNVLGAVLTMVVDSKLSLIRLTATFQTNAVVGINGVELRVHHGLKTDDPEATLYGLEGSYATLTEIIGI